MPALTQWSAGRSCFAASLVLLLLAAAGRGFAVKEPAAGSGAEKQAWKTIPVEIRLSGTPAFGYAVADKRAEPAAVVVTGPQSRVAPMKAAYTHGIDITGATGTVEKEVALDLPEKVETVFSNNRVSAIVRIEEQLVEKTLENVPIRAAHSPYPCVIRPGTVTLTIRGAMLFFSNDFSQQDIEVYVDLEGLGPGIYVKPVEINLPEGVSLVRVRPRVFTVQIQSRDNNS